MQAPWISQGVSRANFDPLHTGHFDPSGFGLLGEQIRAALEAGASGGTPGIQVWTYVRPHGRLEHEVRPPGCDDDDTVRIPSAAGGTSFAPGQSVLVAVTSGGATILGHPPSGSIGQSGFPVDYVDGGAFDEMTIVSVTASVLAGLNDQLITINGTGFAAAPVDDISAVVLDDDEESPTYGQDIADPYVTLHDLVWVSAIQVTMLADASAATPPHYRVGVIGVRG